MLGVAEDLSVLRVHKVILCWEVSTRNGLLLGKKKVSLALYLTYVRVLMFCS